MRVLVTGATGSMAAPFAWMSTLREIFTYRRDVVGLRFGRS